MKIFSAAQIKACDAYTIHASGISSIDLVERAATVCATHIIGHYPTDTPFVVLCGMGNNGADGLALARILLQHGYGLKVFVLQHRSEGTPENKSNLYKILRINAALVEYVEPQTFLTDLPEQVVLIDAILGTGLSTQIEGWLADFFNHINHLPNRKIAIDIPSGMPADTVPHPDTIILSVQETLSFQFYKRSFLHPETGVHCGQIHILDIGLHPTFIEGTHTHYQTVDDASIATFIKKKADFSYKNQHGHTYIVGGSKGKSGAAILATQASLQSGVGLVTSIIPEQCYLPIQTIAPEAMCHTSGENYLEQIIGYEAATSIGIGMGMGTQEISIKAFAQFMETCTIPCVFDADALNMLSIHQELMTKIPENSILTPHVGECERLFGKSANSMQRVEHIRMQAMRYKLCIVLKGHHTVIVTPDGDCYYNLNGNAGMAKGGSGDVLSGLLSGLLAQGYTSVQAALLAVYLHGASGDNAAEIKGKEAMNAGDLIENLSFAWQKLSKT
ncbi:MAG: NAD(P)H-hydrate dehydratase [Phycisphaerales bacterium]|nr:NAD(P)H-hydrate dehydratase [Phycisphaerales bacterium]